MSSRLFLVVLFLWLPGCAHFIVNQEKAVDAGRLEYRFREEASGTNSNSLFICLAFSGGGTRAAALSYGVMEELKRTKIVWEGEEKTLLDEVDCISSVSGGSFTAAYFGLFGDRLFDDFRTRFLEENVQSALIWRLVNPINWVRLASPYFSRIDLAAEYYHEHVFEESTFARFLQPLRRPFTILNATNLVNGERFEFTQEQFEFLGSNLSSYPVARAVAASSAFPFLLSPLTLKNYANHPSDIPRDYQNGLEGYDENRRRYYWAKNRAIYWNNPEVPFLHLMDGGLSDNIGIRPIEAAYRRASGFIGKLANDGEIKKLVIIVVNAHTVEKDCLSRNESPPGLLTVAKKTATIAMENYSMESIEVMRELREARVQAQKDLAACQLKLDQCPGAPQLPTFASAIDPYVIEVNFEAIPDKARREYFLGMPTSFSLEKDQVQALIEVGPQLLRMSPDYSSFLQGLAQQ